MSDAALQKLFRTALRSGGGGANGSRGLESAVAGFRAVLLAQPDYAPALCGLGEALRKLGRIAEAEAVLRTAIERHPTKPDLRRALAETLADWGRLDEALEEAEMAADLARGDPVVLTLIGLLRERRGETALARAALEAACAGVPDAAALTELGRMRRQAGDPSGALAVLDRAVVAARHPKDKAFAEVQRALALLSMGRLREGFRAYDARWKTGLLPNLDPKLSPWTGDALAGRTLLVRCEQGLSDCLQFFRLAGTIEGGRVVVEAPPSLVPLLRASHRVSEVIAQGDPLPPADCWAPLLSLPRLLHIDSDSIPDEVPYLRPDPSLLAEWRERLGPGPKIGIAWRGGEPLFENRRRSVPLEAFAPLAGVDGVRLISLQKGEGRQDVDHVPFPIYDPTDDMDEGPAAFIDTAVVMQDCALIVTADTAIAHLAGALARPCWVVLPEGGDWRFGWHPTHSAWYPTVECLRKPPGGSWQDVFAEIARRLNAIRQGRTDDPEEEEDGPEALQMDAADSGMSSDESPEQAGEEADPPGSFPDDHQKFNENL